MNALISASDIKTFYNALHCLSRFSETFWLQCSPRANAAPSIRLSAINATNSAFCMFAFDPDFFLSVSTASNQKIECQIQLKTILSILRSRGRNVERLSLSLTTQGACRFTLTLHCHHSILKTHHLTYEPKRGLLPTADPNPPNFFCIQPTTAAEWLDHFLSTSRTGEITLLCTPTTCIARSKEEELPETRGAIRKAIATEVKIAVDEFKEYCVLQESRLTFSLREFKATVSLAEAWGVAMEVNFSDGDEPVFVRLRKESCVAAEFVVATTKGGEVERQQAVGDGETTKVAASATSEPNTRTSLTHPAPIPNHSTPLPLPHDDDATQPLFFPGASQLSLPPTQETLPFVQPTPISQGGDPGEFLDPHQPLSESSRESKRDDAEHDSGSDSHTNSAPRKRFKPLF